ncbi:MAG: VOC family protein [Novosphingobium sp.]
MFKGTEKVVQAGFVVRNLDEAVERWFRKGAGPFQAFRDIDIPLFYRMEESSVRLNLALGQFDGVQIELIEPLGPGPSLFAECYPDGYPDEALHHWGVIADDYDAFVETHAAEGRPLVMNGEFSGYRFGFVDTRNSLGFMLEAFEKTPSLLDFFQKIETLGKTWDGQNPYSEAL